MLIDEPPVSDSVSSKASAKSLKEPSNNHALTVYLYIAGLAMDWDKNRNIGLVVGATSPNELKEIRTLIGEEMPILIPGVGAQGGDLEGAIEGGSNSKGNMAIINISRGIIYSDDGSSFQDSVRVKASSYKESIIAVSKSKRA
jgi:orotidine-5'-phosphate decarboxylase